MTEQAAVEARKVGETFGPNKLVVEAIANGKMLIGGAWWKVDMPLDLVDNLIRRGWAPHVWNTLKTSVYAGASDEMLLTVLDYCQARKKDPIKKPVNIVPMSVLEPDPRNPTKKIKVKRETLWPSIFEFRSTAAETREYAGKDEVIFGPEKTETFIRQYRDDEPAKNYTVTYPEWAQVTVYRIVQGQRVAFTTERIYWKETAQFSFGAPTEIWVRRPFGQLAKCVEAQALRQAFPHEIGGSYTEDEARPEMLTVGAASEGELAYEPEDTVAGALQTGTAKSKIGKLEQIADAAATDLQAQKGEAKPAETAKAAEPEPETTGQQQELIPPAEEKKPEPEAPVGYTLRESDAPDSDSFTYKSPSEFLTSLWQETKKRGMADGKTDAERLAAIDAFIAANFETMERAGKVAVRGYPKLTANIDKLRAPLIPAAKAGA